MKPLNADTKIRTLESLLPLRQAWRLAGNTVVFTNGCFDLLHVGHIRSLQAASQFGDRLIVGLNSDASVSRLKGSDRPLVPQAERAEILAALAVVDAVVVFDEATPEAAIRVLQPDVHCKGADYAPPHGKPIPEKALVESYGGRVEYLPLFPERSSTLLIRAIRSTPSPSSQ